MKRRITTCVLGILLVCSLLISVSAMSQEDNYIYFVDGKEVAEEDYPLSVKGLCENDKIEETTEAYGFDYYIVNENGAKKVSEEEYYTTFGVNMGMENRTLGSWTIRGSVIEPGKTKYYFKGNGDDFDVASDEAIELRIDAKTYNREFTVGCTGTSYFDAPIFVPKDKIPVISFVRSIERPGTYRVFITNDGDVRETVDGRITVLNEDEVHYNG